MPAPELNPDLAADVDVESFDTVARGNHLTHGDARSAGNHHIDRSCVVRQNIYCGKALEGGAFQINLSAAATYVADPEDPQYDDEHIYVTTLVGGFIKNDADGNFLFDQPGDGSGGATELNGLSDVTISSPSAGEHLVYNGATWVNADPGHTSEVNDLTASVTWANVPDANITQSSVVQHEAALTITESQISDLQAYLTVETNDLTAAVVWANVPDANVTESSVTQHEAALSITESQISDLQAYVLPADSINILADVDTTTVAPSSGDHLEWDGTNWVPAVPGHTVEANDLTASVTWANVPDLNVTQSSVVQHEAALTITESQISDLQAYLTVETNDLTAAVVWANVPDLNVTQSSVVQHEAALTITESQISDLQAYLTVETNDLTAAVVWANVPDANVTQSSVVQHEAALTITESQISDLQAYLLDITGQNLGDLADVTITTGVEDNVLQLVGGVWINRADIELASTAAVYVGDAATDGSWRLVRNGTDLEVQLRESGTYNVKGSFQP